TVIRKLKEFKFEMNWQKLPEIMSWDEYSFKKGKMSFTSFCSFTFRKSKLIISLT
ncbi:ISL3 family transposase, partial [Streptococcus anginosus]